MGLLGVRGLDCGYGRLQVLWDVELAVEPGQSVVLLGANGAGKTTLLRAVVGLLPAWRGRIVFADEDITRLRPDQRIRRGIAFMSELGVFPTLSIRENLRMGGYFLTGAEVERRARRLYERFPALAERRGELAASLSGGQRKMLGVAKALIARPRLLVMDEPSAGLAPIFVKQVVEVLGSVHTEGMALLIAEQNVSFIPLAQRGYVLDGGSIAFTGERDELRDSEVVRRAYFGV